MAKTTVSTTDALKNAAFERVLFEDMAKESYFSKFHGKTQTSLVYEKELQPGNAKTINAGDNCTFGIRMRLTGSGVTSGQTLTGNEEALSTYDFKVELEEYAHAIIDDGPLSRWRPIYDMDAEMRSALQTWGTEKLDQLQFTAIQAAPTVLFVPNSTFKYTALATAKTALATADKITPDYLSKVKTWAKTGGNRTQTPLTPIRINGKDHYVALFHEDVMYDLRTNAVFQTALKDARERDSSNPLFSGAEAYWDGVIIHSHESVNIGTDGGGASVPWSQGVLMGAQALCFAWGSKPKLVNETQDYGRNKAVSIQMVCGMEKPKFNSKDYGSVGLLVSRTQVSDAA